MCAMANVGSSFTAFAPGERLTLGQCRPYEQCGQCGINGSECPNRIVVGSYCACGQPLTQADLWRAVDGGALTCRYCRIAAPYLPDVLAEARSMPQPVALEDLWLTCPWRPKLTPVIITHLQAAGIKFTLPDLELLSSWERRAFDV